MSSVYTSIAYSFRMSLEKFSQVHDVYIQLYCDFVVSLEGCCIQRLISEKRFLVGILMFPCFPPLDPTMSQMKPVDVLTPSFIKWPFLRSFRKSVVKSGNEFRHLFLSSDRLSAWKNLAANDRFS